MGGADVKKRTNDDFTALHIAAYFGHPHLIPLLIEYGLDINTDNKNHVTPLHCAIKPGNNAVVTALLDQGANINAQQHRGETPLHTAIYNDESNIIQTLLERGPETNLKNSDKLTPLDCAYCVEGQQHTSLLEHYIYKCKQTRRTPSPDEITLEPTGNRYTIKINKKIPANLRDNASIKETMQALQHWPNTTGLNVKKLKTENNAWRVRCGKFRIIFTPQETKKNIYITKVGFRKKIYDDVQQRMQPMHIK